MEVAREYIPAKVMGPYVTEVPIDDMYARLANTADQQDAQPGQYKTFLRIFEKPNTDRFLRILV